MIEKYTENLVLNQLGCQIGENDYGFVFPQGDVPKIEKIVTLLKKAGGKPKECSLRDFSKGGNGKAQPEFILTFNKNLNTIIVIECKKALKQHSSKEYNFPKGYAVDGVLYYAKFLKEEYNIIAIAVSGTRTETMKVNTFYWSKGQDEFIEIKKAQDIIYEPENYLNIIQGRAIRKSISIEEIQKLALTMHNSLRELKITEKAKPVFIAGILIALKDETFVREYESCITFKSLVNKLQEAIEDVLKDSDIKKEKIDDIKSHFKIIGRNEKLRDIQLGHYNSLMWYINQLETKIKPMMDFADSSIDALGIFYHEFVKYSGGDGSGLGIVLTPQHLTDFMCEIAGVNKNSKVLDICCGSGSFLVTAMSKMFKHANNDEIKKIKKESLFGVESDDDIYTLAIANMIVRGDGKSNIIFKDCFKKEVYDELKTKNINIGLINPPYSQKDHCELEFVERMLDILVSGGVGVVVVPMSCAIGTKFKDTRERLLKKHTLKAVFSMPDDIFYSNNASTNVCVMVFEAHKQHDTSKPTFFGYYKDDGFVKAKKLGRIDKFNKWESIKNEWVVLYQEKDIKNGVTAKKCINHYDEWLCEAYMETDYSKLRQLDFEKTVRLYLAYLILNSEINLESKYSIEQKNINLNVHKWQKFHLTNIFHGNITRGKRLKSEDRESGQVKYFSASETNNGMTDLISNPLFTDKNALIYTTFGDCFYVQDNFTASDEINIFHHPKLNKYNGLFLVTVINQNKYRYKFGRKAFFNKFKDEVIMLPATKDGMPDFEFMECYIKNLTFSDKI